jgi:hypothetical protein
MFALSVVDPIRLSATSLKALATQTRVFPVYLREASLDLQFQHHLESVEENLRLTVILKEVSDVICHSCYRVGVEQEASVRVRGCRLSVGLSEVEASRRKLRHG